MIALQNMLGLNRSELIYQAGNDNGHLTGRIATVLPPGASPSAQATKNEKPEGAVIYTLSDADVAAISKKYDDVRDFIKVMAAHQIAAQKADLFTELAARYGAPYAQYMVDQAPAHLFD